jgi:shikimate kinase
MRLYLIGMPGAGKTTLGRGLATFYKVPFYDLDEEIVRREGRSIPAIFGKEGEAYFREVEAATLREVVNKHAKLVLATGGGTPCFHQNIDVLLGTGLTLYLAVPVEELVRRLQRAATSRPLLAQLPDAQALEARLRETLGVREQFYDRAPLRCAAAACSVENVQRLIAHYRTTG